MPRNGLIGAIALVVLLLGAFGMSVVGGLYEPPQRQVVDDLGPLVRVMSVQPRDLPLTVRGFGTVRAKRLWSVVPEVSGTVVRLSPNRRARLLVNSFGGMGVPSGGLSIPGEGWRVRFVRVPRRRLQRNRKNWNSLSRG